MRAVVCDEFGPFKNMTIQDVAAPQPAPDQVLIDLKATGVSFAQNLLVAGKYQRKPPLPFTPGVEIAGIVTACGQQTSHFSVGDRVYGTINDGGFAEQAVAHETFLHPMPNNMDFAEATLFPVSYPTSYAALIWKAQLQADETVLVHAAAGAVGMAAVQIAKAKGAKVIATASTDEKCAKAEGHGADLAINYSTSNFRDAVKDWTDGEGVDVVIDPVGGDVLIESLRCMGRESRLLTLGYTSGDIPKAPVNLLLVKNMSIIGLNYGTYLGWSPGDDGSAYTERRAVMQADLSKMFADGQLKPEVSHSFGLEGFNEAMNTVLERRSTGKVVLLP
jgi:NADPH:quinone reductase